jgi:tRNA-uridine 2-sulfurtransferase
MEKQKTKVVVAMSGGVDSSVAAALMVENGYVVTGMMLKLWSADCDVSDNACCTPEAIDQAKQVARLLGIPFYVIDVKDEFKRKIVNPFIDNNFAGLTPNPCFWCNRTIRWGVLLEKVLTMGADFLVTGHYASISRDESGKFHLLKGVDEKKDQSYVLSGLNQHQLSRTLLPLGQMRKEGVRQKAHQLKLPVASKRDSQDLCFIGNDNYRKFLSDYSISKPKPGNIVDKLGNVIGTHNGLQDYTIGQRKGLGSGNTEPVYVVSKILKTNEIVIGGRSDLLFDMIKIGPINWISGSKPGLIQSFGVKIRYKASIVSCKFIDDQPSTQTIKLEKPVRDATPGQIAVLYLGDEVMGSAEIVATGLEGK